MKKGDTKFVTVGIKHIRFWDTEKLDYDKGIYGKEGEITSFTCAAYDNHGTCYTGGVNGRLYIWSNGRTLLQSIKTSKKGEKAKMVSALRWVDGILYCGNKDGKLILIHSDTL